MHEELQQLNASIVMKGQGFQTILMMHAWLQKLCLWEQVAAEKAAKEAAAKNAAREAAERQRLEEEQARKQVRAMLSSTDVAGVWQCLAAGTQHVFSRHCNTSCRFSSLSR